MMHHVEDGTIRFDLNFTYEGEEHAALNNVNGSIASGQCIVLCGASGCGKSTLLRCMNRLIPDFYEGNLHGFCYINGHDISSMSAGEVGAFVCSVFQDPRSQFYTTNSSSEAAFALENYGFPHDEITKRVDGVFSAFGLEKLKGRNVFALSSGERQLVAILSAQALDGKILLLDEPTANLDAAAISELAEVLTALKKRGKTIIISEHRLYYLRDIADEYWLLDSGRITAQYSRAEMLNLSPAQLQCKALRVLDLHDIAADPPPEMVSKQQNRLKADSLTFSYHKNGDRILDGLSFEAMSGQVIGLIGSNGSGKTTLGKLTAGLFKPCSGTFYWNDQPQTPTALLQKGIFIMQEAEFQFFTNSVWNELLYGRVPTPALKAAAAQMLKEFSLWEHRNRHPFSLSGGQMQKLVMLLGYFSPKPVVILDEPTAGLDEGSLQSSIHLIREMRKNKIVFIISHDLELISKTCSHCLWLANGTVSQTFNLYQKGAFQQLTQCMHNDCSLSDNRRPLTQNQKTRLCDPRVKLLYLLAALLVSLATSKVLISCAVISCLILTLYEKRYVTALVYSLLYGAVFLGYYLAPQSIMLFIVNYFPRFFPVCLALTAVSEDGDTARLSAALRRLHCPEKAIMIVSVVFRFLPVLCNDLKIMYQSIRTRALSHGFFEKIRFLPQYLENIIVPMVFRVMRIAESLSASAETRGIALKRKRDCYIKLRMHGSDIFFLALLTASAVLGIIL